MDKVKVNKMEPPLIAQVAQHVRNKEIAELRELRQIMADKISDMIDKINDAKDKGTVDVAALNCKRQAEKNWFLVNNAIMKLEEEISKRVYAVISSRNAENNKDS